MLFESTNPASKEKSSTRRLVGEVSTFVCTVAKNKGTIPTALACPESQRRQSKDQKHNSQRQKIGR